MDSLDHWAILVAVAEQGSFVGAARKLGRSPAAVTRAVAALEDRLSVRLLTRTTRAVALTEAGERYVELCRRVLADIHETESVLAGERLQAQGTLNLTAPVVFGRHHVLPLVRKFMADHPGIRVNLLLLDRLVSFVDEGVDMGVRIGNLPDSSLRAVQVGNVRRVLCASPDYLARRGFPRSPRDLAEHEVVAVAGLSPIPDRWNFVFPEGEATVPVKPRLQVNTVEAALDVVAAGGGLGRFLSYQVAPLRRQGALQTLLHAWEPPPVPVHLVYPAGRHLPLRVRLFLDSAAPALRALLARVD